MHQIIYEYLVNVARNRRLCSYSDIAPLADLDLNEEADRIELASYLAEICRYEEQRGRPMLSALVIHLGGDNNPGNGFFELAQQMNRFEDTRENLARAIFWANEVSTVHVAWAAKIS